ncbi:MAG: hypothetical protein FJ028_07885 [Chloroflexi bacterium]|nr:hypothetical protein [Chloroflexota bacterium]
MDERTILVDGRRVRVIEARAATETDDPLVMIHGLGGWAENWSEIVLVMIERPREMLEALLPFLGQTLGRDQPSLAPGCSTSSSPRPARPGDESRVSQHNPRR